MFESYAYVCPQYQLFKLRFSRRTWPQKKRMIVFYIFIILLLVFMIIRFQKRSLHWRSTVNSRRID